MNNKFQILHISDLHITEESGFNRSVVLDALLERVKADQETGLKPEIVVVTGDIAFKGVTSVYPKAKLFFDSLLDCLALTSDKLFIVPGNHDVNTKLYRRSDVLDYENMEELNSELENENYRADLFKGMEEYFSFIEENYPHLKSKNKGLVPFVHSYTSNCGKKIGITGLNSAWMTRQKPGKVAIGEYQIKKAFDELNELGSFDLRLNLFHHPIDILWEDDSLRNSKYLNRSILLCGHMHETKGGFVSDLNSMFFKFHAGATYNENNQKTLNRFQYITIDWEKNNIQLDFRKFEIQKGTWVLDGDTGDDGKKTFDLKLITGTSADKAKSAEELTKEIEADITYLKYIESLRMKHRHLPTQGFETNFRHPIDIEEVYVNMRGHFPGRELKNDLQDKERNSERIKNEESLDIKGAIRVLNKARVNAMVFLGDPGSGKTLLLKYILMMLAKGRGEEILGIDNRTIPFFAPLRELSNPDSTSLEGFLNSQCDLKKFSITKKMLKNLLQTGKALILLDGLDEVADKDARKKTCEWIDRAKSEFTNTTFLITSRIAGYLPPIQLEGAVPEFNIHDFTLEEAEKFLINWFSAVEVALHPGDEIEWRQKGTQNALELTKKIRASEYLVNLAKNPLILQIIALVHRDRGTLPQRRVELYDECVNVLLEKWDMAKGLNTLLTAREARKVLQPLALWLHKEDKRRSAPMREIIDVIKVPLEGMGKTVIDPEALLLNIRDRSGIFMGYNESEYGFTHLGFQEYLAAEEIRNRRKTEILLENYSEKWWREVILLCLALDNTSVIEEFMEKIIETEIFKSEITIIQDAIKDSIEKPIKPFIDALNNEKFGTEVKDNAKRILRYIGTPKAMEALREKVSQIELTGAVILGSIICSGGINIYKKEIINEKDGSEMVLIPAGNFFFGSRDDDKNASSDEKPQRVINLPDYYMDKYPVTNEQFCRFLKEVNPSSEQLTKWIDLKGNFRNEKCRIEKNSKKYVVQKGYDRHPVIYVSCYGAKAYAVWAGKRLPTEQEWEKAARGSDGYIYPWGNKFNEKLCNSAGAGIGGTTEVGKYPEGKSPYGCHDMAGNAWEWTASFYDKDKKYLVLRGGSWLFSQEYMRCANRSNFPVDRNNLVGFRLSRTL